MADSKWKHILDGSVDLRRAVDRLKDIGPEQAGREDRKQLLIFLGLCGIPFHGLWRLLLSWPLFWPMEMANHQDWQDFVGIMSLLIINSTISFIEENNAGNAAAALMAGLALKTKVLRDGKWGEQEAAILVPGDIISIKLGDIVPADARLLEGDALKIDQSALTGESLPVTKNPGVECILVPPANKVKLRLLSLPQESILSLVLTAIGNFCICSIAIGIVIELVVMYPIQHRKYRSGIDNLLVLLIGGIPIAMPTVLSVTMAIGSHRLSEQGAITKRMTAIEEMAGMDVLCSDKTGTLTLNKLTVDKNLIEVFSKDADKDHVILQGARASRVENQDAIDACIVGMLADPKEARAGITEVHFFHSIQWRSALLLLILIDSGNWHRVSKVLQSRALQPQGRCKEQSSVHHRQVADRGLRSLAVCEQTVPEKTKEGAGTPWVFTGLLPLFDPPRHDSGETIKRALHLGVNVKMITGDQLAIAKETGRRLGMGTNMYPSSSLLGQHKDESIASYSVEELIEKADGFAGVFPEHKYEIVKKLQERKHICGMTGDGVNDAPALKKADIGIAVADATDAARGASDIVLTEPGLSVIVSAVLTSRAIFQRMKNYTIYAVSITIRVVLGFMLLALIWKFDFSPFMVLIIAILNDGTIMTISKDKVKPSPMPDSWKLREIFTTGIVFGTYLAVMTVVFFWAVQESTFFTSSSHLCDRSRSWSYIERPGLLLVFAFLVAQLIATVSLFMQTGSLQASRASGGLGGCHLVIQPRLLHPSRHIQIHYQICLSGKAWKNMIDNRTAFTSKKNYGRSEREAQWAMAQRTLHGLRVPESSDVFKDSTDYRELSEIAEQAKKRAEVARLRELHTLKGHVESVVKLKGLDVGTIQQNYTV
ncbi:hypothetical protein SASPL_157355 [Salvia splendens]|uniref:Plasma membrane ATPase n=1 Tax=Salvia splendens TaxID=180675 RepID=A0A8X8VV24_SALSN|nr:hypothetical protein SASPL_157355 [Salvia splendens]